MRLLTRKIYRAFPELDQFDDEACIRYIRRVWSTEGFSRFSLVICFTIPIALVLWVIVIIAAAVIFDLPFVYPYHSDVLTLMETGFVWFPLAACFVVRDFWLARQVRKQIDGACCEDCGYCLVGLEIKPSNQDESVQCPECDMQHILDDYKLSREDIQPSPATP